MRTCHLLATHQVGVGYAARSFATIDAHGGFSMLVQQHREVLVEVEVDILTHGLPAYSRTACLVAFYSVTHLLSSLIYLLNHLGRSGRRTREGKSGCFRRRRSSSSSPSRRWNLRASNPSRLHGSRREARPLRLAGGGGDQGAGRAWADAMTETNETSPRTDGGVVCTRRQGASCGTLVVCKYQRTTEIKSKSS